DGTGEHPDEGGQPGGGGRGAEPRGESAQAERAYGEMQDDVHRVGGLRREDEAQPGRGIEHLGRGVGEHRLAEAGPGIPDGERARVDRPGEGRVLAVQHLMEVALEEHLASEHQAGEERREDGENEKPEEHVPAHGSRQAQARRARSSREPAISRIRGVLSRARPNAATPSSQLTGVWGCRKSKGEMDTPTKPVSSRVRRARKRVKAISSSDTPKRSLAALTLNITITCGFRRFGSANTMRPPGFKT